MSVNIDKLVRMAEQITANLSYTDDEAVVSAKVADHLNRFWDPRMKDSLRSYAEGHGENLSPMLRAAIAQIN
jgi:formate dehydrogenase subunit delta